MNAAAKPATYTVLSFTSGRGERMYVAMAWTDTCADMISAEGRTYTEARAGLDTKAAKAKLELRCFDGEHRVG
jgi:hypothetical protein